MTRKLTGRAVRLDFARVGDLTLMVAALVIASVSQAGAGWKLYDMDHFLRESQARLERLNVPRHPSDLGAEAGNAHEATGRSNLAASTSALSGGEDAAGSRPPFLSEIAVGAWWHDPGQDNNESNSLDLNLELVFPKLRWFDSKNRVVRFLLSPRPVLGGSVNSDNETHTVYLELDWTYQFDNGLFVGVSFGPSYHTGNLEQETRQCAPGEGCSLPGNRAFVDTGEVTLGSPILFRESLEVGYRFGGHGVALYAAHISNAGLDNDNDGMNFVGLRYSFSFDPEFRN